MVMKRGLNGGSLRMLGPKEMEAVHSATLRVLSEVGLSTKSDRILNIFAEGGANVFHSDGKIMIPEELIGEALKKAPSKVLLCGRNSEHDILLQNDMTYFGFGGTPTPNVRDIETGEIRPSRKKDFVEATRLGDALPNMSIIMGIAAALDVPYEVEYLHEFEALFNNTEKPIVYSTPGVEGTRRVLEMARMVAGGADELRERPILSVYCETPSPLMFGSENENIIECAEAGIPVTLGPDPMVGGTGPGTVAGTIVVNNAENLASIVLSQLVNPGAPIIYGGWAAVMDLWTGNFSYMAPEFALTASVFNSQMARHYGLPNFGYCAGSDSKVPDAQAGAEAMMQALMASLAGVNLTHDCGYLASGMVGSMEMAVICEEVLGIVSKIVKGIRIDEESLAVDIIKDVGPGGHFLSQKHTLKHLKEEILMPTIFDRSSEVSWSKKGKKDVIDAARGRVKKILQEHQPHPLPNDVQQRLAELVKNAERDLARGAR
jgi:trimethylamine--corrinoid protein Co-methyltransferase